MASETLLKEGMTNAMWTMGNKAVKADPRLPVWNADKLQNAVQKDPLKGQ
jgi:hypothetical protein